MKNIVRAFAVALVLTGTVATAHTIQTGNATVAKATVSAIPVPGCPPDDHGCGIAH